MRGLSRLASVTGGEIMLPGAVLSLSLGKCRDSSLVRGSLGRSRARESAGILKGGFSSEKPPFLDIFSFVHKLVLFCFHFLYQKFKYGYYDVYRKEAEGRDPLPFPNRRSSFLPLFFPNTLCETPAASRQRELSVYGRKPSKMGSQPSVTAVSRSSWVFRVQVTGWGFQKFRHTQTFMFLRSANL